MGLAPAYPGTLVDLLDRVLDRGLLINADIIITLAGVPLVGIKLSAAVAGWETMMDYGFLLATDLQPNLEDSGGGGPSSAAVDAMPEGVAGPLLAWPGA